MRLSENKVPSNPMFYCHFANKMTIWVATLEDCGVPPVSCHAAIHSLAALQFLRYWPARLTDEMSI